MSNKDFLKKLFGIDENLTEKQQHDLLKKNVQTLDKNAEWSIVHNHDSLTLSLETTTDTVDQPMVGYSLEFFNDGSAIFDYYRSKECRCPRCRTTLAIPATAFDQLLMFLNALRERKEVDKIK